MENSEGFIPIVAIFYAVFHPTEGTKIVHQVPEGSISTIKDIREADDKFPTSSLFNFDTVKNYIIPKPQLCNKLITLKIDKFKVVGYPVNIENSNYSRNSFNFNFCFVFPYDSGDTTPYELAVKRMGKMFQVLEEQSFMLSKLDKDNSFFKEGNVNCTDNNPTNEGISLLNESTFSLSNINSDSKSDSYFTRLTEFQASHNLNTPGHSKTKKISLSSTESLIHQIYQDLNNYSECCIPLDTSNSVDIKLFPILPPPINIKAHQVPVSTVKLNSLVDVNWDPTMVKILPYINGINSIKKISELANSNYLLTKQCIQHLMHYKCIEISDIFQFSNIYAPTNYIGNFLRLNGRMAEECQAYVITSDRNIESMMATPASHTPSANSPYNTTPYAPTASPYITSRKIQNPMNIMHGITSVSPFTKASYLSKSPKTTASTPGMTVSIVVPSKATLFYLYRSLNQGQTVKDWYVQHRKLLQNIDIRRFINFGILRGIIYRVHSYPLLNSIIRATESDDHNEYDNIIDMMKKKTREQKGKVERKDSQDKRISSGNRDKLLKTRVNVRTLTTVGAEGKRKVSFNYKNSKSHLDFYGSDGSENEDNDNENSIYSSGDERRRRRKSRTRTLSSTMRKRPTTNGRLTPNNEEALTSSGEEDATPTDVDAEEEDDDSTGESEMNSDEIEEEEATIKLIKMLRGHQHFDSINTELQRSRLEVEKMIESLGSYSIISS